MKLELTLDLASLMRGAWAQATGLDFGRGANSQYAIVIFTGL